MKHSTVTITVRFDRGDQPPFGVLPNIVVARLNNTQTNMCVEQTLRDQESFEHVLRIDSQGIMTLELRAT